MAPLPSLATLDRRSTPLLCTQGSQTVGASPNDRRSDRYAVWAALLSLDVPFSILPSSLQPSPFYTKPLNQSPSILSINYHFFPPRKRSIGHRGLQLGQNFGQVHIARQDLIPEIGVNLQEHNFFNPSPSKEQKRTIFEHVYMTGPTTIVQSSYAT